MNAGIRSNEHMGKHPVIYISFKDAVSDLSLNAALNEIATQIVKVAREYEFLRNSPKLSKEDVTTLENILNLANSRDSVDIKSSIITSSLQNLSYFLNKHFNKKVVLLIDEYDAPLAKLYNYDF